MKSILLCFLFTIVAWGQAAEMKCFKRNEEFKCGNSCSETCQKDVVCATQCTEGCYCRNGYVKNRHGTCIPKEKCTNSEIYGCKKNQKFNECRSKCPATCSNMNNAAACLMACDTEGCECKEGTVLNSKGDCVAPTKCTKEEVVCPDTTVYNPKCRKFMNNCLDQCGCPSGKILDKNTHKCQTRAEIIEAKTKECQVQDANKEYAIKNSRLCLDGTPHSLLVFFPWLRPYDCYCKDGYFLDKTANRCLTSDECKAIKTSTNINVSPKIPEREMSVTPEGRMG